MYKSIVLFIAFFCCQNLLAQQFVAGPLSIKLDNKGKVVSIKNNEFPKEYVALNSEGNLLQIVKDSKNIEAEKAAFSKNTITLFFPEGEKAVVKVGTTKSYLRFELVDISDKVEAVTWGSFNNTIADTIGNTVGVVRNSDFAFGLQCLNIKTSGGELTNEEGAVYETGSTAVAKPFGSSLQAFTINRQNDRTIKVWNRWPDVIVKGIKDGGLRGSAIALFGSKPNQVLTVIETIAKEEKLPYAQWKNEWIKTSAACGQAYMITSFNENNIDAFLSLASRMGMAGVYHEDPFETWGHFELKKDVFPHGREGFKKCVEKAHALGLRLGFHTLTTFITTNDAYVTPKPHPGLALAGTDLITENITADATAITVSSNTHFTLRSDLNSVIIGDEIIRFMGVSETAPYKLTGCIRGAFGTTKTNHSAGTKVSRLVDHPYKVFFPGWQLQKEIATNIANFINETGADQMDFDGHEGTFANGIGDLSFNSFAEEVFKQSNHPMVFGSSRANHYFWHINNYLNWGEPWYGGFRESQSDVRIANQKFLESNYLPNMLGWFLITAQTSPEDVDWMLARAAGFNAGYSLVVREDALANKSMNEIINLINIWTAAKNKKLFTAQQKEWLKNPDNEAHLTKAGENYLMERYRKFVFEHQAKILQPGEPLISTWNFENKTSKQQPRIILLANGENGKIDRPVIEIDNSFHLEIPTSLSAGESLLIDNTVSANLYNHKGQLIKKIALGNALPELSVGSHIISFNASMNPKASVKAVITVRLSEKTEQLQQQN